MKLTLASASQTFEVIAAVLAMAAATFPEQLVHLGGDETNTDCWSASPAITAWMAASGHADAESAFNWLVSGLVPCSFPSNEV